MAADALEIRMARLEGAYEQINMRLDTLHSDVQGLGQKLDANFRWVIGVILVNWVSLMLAVLLHK